MYYNPSKSNRFLAQPKITNLIEKAATDLFVLDIIPYNWYLSKTVVTFCKLLDGKLCDIIFAISEGYPAKDVDNLDRYDVYLSYIPSDSGAFNYAHYADQYRSSDGKPHFTRLDHGEKINMQKYNQTTPPDYELGNIKIPLALFNGKYDDLADPEDVKWL